jgi:hypothetical protein
MIILYQETCHHEICGCGFDVVYFCCASLGLSPQRQLSRSLYRTVGRSQGHNPEFGNYMIISTDDAGMTASYDVGSSRRQRTNSVVLNPQGTGCEMTVQSTYRGLAHDDAGDFKTRVDASWPS